MEYTYPELTGRPQSVLVATMISSGCREPYFKSGIGVEYGVDHHRFESLSHSISGEDELRLFEMITKSYDADPTFWDEYVTRATLLGSQLIKTIHSSLLLAGQPCSHRELLEGFLRVADAMQEIAPFVVATPVALGVLTSRLKEDRAEVNLPSLLPRLLNAWSEPEPVHEMRNGYRIALEILRSEGASELFRTTSPMIALRRVEDEFPELHQSIRNHVDEYGWLRTLGYRYEPLSPESLVYRIELALIRWPMEAIREAAHSDPVPVIEEALGCSPSESRGGEVAAIQAMLTQRVFRVDAHLHAECLARPFLGSIADALGCTTRQILLASVDEIVAGLSDQRELPIAEMERRAGNGFTVEREHDEVVVHGGDSPTGSVLTGMTACRGTAVGRVRIVLDQGELLQLEIGDVIVTAASTIDPTDATGESTVFPTRNGGPHAHALQRAAAVVADEGGLLSHAAIVCRERGLPCLLGTERATTALVDGQMVEVDATKPLGIVIPLSPPW